MWIPGSALVALTDSFESEFLSFPWTDTQKNMSGLMLAVV